MTPIKSINTRALPDSKTSNRTSNGVYPVKASMCYVYVLRSRGSGRLYTGFTSDLKKRLTDHIANYSKAMDKRGPYDLIYYEACLNSTDARARERYLETGPGKRYLKNRV